MSKFLPLAQIIFLLAAVTFWQAFFKFGEEADTYFVMNLGRYILEHGFPHIDPFTIHENLQLVAQQWLSGVLFWEAYKNFGVDGLLAVDSFFGAATVLIFWRLCLFVSGGNKILSFALSFFAAMFYATMVVPRPHIISATLLLVEVFCLEKFTRTENPKFLIALPLVSAALSNFHAAVWLMSLVVCLPFLFVKNFRHIKFLLAAMVGITLFGLLNPAGFEAMTYVFRSYGIESINANIKEMATPTAHGFQGKHFFLTEAFLIFSLARGKVPWRYIFLSGGITFMALMHGRNLPLFYFIATFPLAYVWRDFSLEKFKTQRIPLTILLFLLIAAFTAVAIALLKELHEELSLPLEILLVAVILFVLYVLLIPKVEGRILHPILLPRKNLSLLGGLLIAVGIFMLTIVASQPPPSHMNTDAIKFLLRTERPENISLYAGQGVGGLAGHLGVKYYIDARSEVFLKANNGQKDIFNEYLDFTGGKLNYKEFFARYNFTHILITNESAFLFDELSADKNFRVVYESERVEGSKVIRCKIFVPKSGG
ncbi:MAG: hypothetical protein IJG80_02425 [Selenomonadaceae bacterium]|nr:hypothetical protein [Selenomonadaceae bacterium]